MLISLVLLSIFVLAACTTQAPATDSANEQTEADAVTSASQAVDEESFKKGISKEGNFIVITSSDLSFTEDLLVDGEFLNSSGNPVRSLALAQYDEDGNPIRYKLTVPRIAINSENTLLEYGTIEGDVYIQAPGFRTKEATIDGNLYFATQELLDEFAADELSSVTKEIGVKEYTE
ncbi:MAG: hypothetical protein WCZ27_07645 [Tissierellaceae bacterium]